MAILRRWTATPVTLTPSNHTSPEVGTSSPAISRIRLVLPDKVGPRSTLSELRSRRSEMSLICASPAITLETLFSSSILSRPRLLGLQRPPRRRTFPGDEIRQLGRLLRRQLKSPLGPPPEHVVGRPCPFVLDQVADLGFIEVGAEMPPKVAKRARQAKQGLCPCAVEARQPPDEGRLEKRVGFLYLRHQSVETGRRKVPAGQRRGPGPGGAF